MGLRICACSGFLRFTRSVYATRKGVNFGLPARGLVHLDAGPGAARDPVVERPAPAADRATRLRGPEGRGAVEPGREPAPFGELPVEVVHDLVPEQIAAAMALVEHDRVIEERLDEKDLSADEAAEPLHGIEDSREQAEAPAHLPGGQAILGSAHLLIDIAREGAEERVAPVA